MGSQTISWLAGWNGWFMSKIYLDIHFASEASSKQETLDWAKWHRAGGEEVVLI